MLHIHSTTPAQAGVCDLWATEKGRVASALFIPNLTINLTYLCYGKTKLLVLRKIKKEFCKKFNRDAQAAGHSDVVTLQVSWLLF